MALLISAAIFTALSVVLVFMLSRFAFGKFPTLRHLIKYSYMIFIYYILFSLPITDYVLTSYQLRQECSCTNTGTEHEPTVQADVRARFYPGPTSELLRSESLGPPADRIRTTRHAGRCGFYCIPALVTHGYDYVEIETGNPNELALIPNAGLYRLAISERGDPECNRYIEWELEIARRLNRSGFLRVSDGRIYVELSDRGDIGELLGLSMQECVSIQEAGAVTADLVLLTEQLQTKRQSKLGILLRDFDFQIEVLKPSGDAVASYSWHEVQVAESFFSNPNKAFGGFAMFVGCEALGLDPLGSNFGKRAFDLIASSPNRKSPL